MIEGKLMIDSKDKAILEEYLKDSRQSYREIARKTGISATSVAARVSKMEEEGIIKKYTIQIDPEKLGYELTVLMSVDTQAFKFFTEEHNLHLYFKHCQDNGALLWRCLVSAEWDRGGHGPWAIETPQSLSGVGHSLLLHTIACTGNADTLFGMPSSLETLYRYST